MVAVDSGGESPEEHECCLACDFDGSLFDNAELLIAIRGFGHRWEQLLAESGFSLRIRPEPNI
jgi:hypothetical protein